MLTDSNFIWFMTALSNRNIIKVTCNLKISSSHIKVKKIGEINFYVLFNRYKIIFQHMFI